MLAKKFRFHGFGALKFVYSKGKTVRSRSIGLRFVKNNRRQESRLAVVVSKKVSKKAPERNRIRRRVYEQVRLRWAMIEPGYDLAITIFDKEALSMTTEKLSKAVDDLLRQAKVTKL